MATSTCNPARADYNVTLQEIPLGSDSNSDCEPREVRSEREGDRYPRTCQALTILKAVGLAFTSRSSEQ